jgi:hypothetical protein
VAAGPDLDSPRFELGDRRHVGRMSRLGHEHGGSLGRQNPSRTGTCDAGADDHDPFPREPSGQSSPPRAMKSA